MPANLTGWHFVIILLVILLLFGAAKLPALAKSMGQSARVFKGEIKAMKEDDAPRESAQNTAADASPTVTPPAAPSDPTAGATDVKP